MKATRKDQETFLQSVDKTFDQATQLLKIPSDLAHKIKVANSTGLTHITPCSAVK